MIGWIVGLGLAAILGPKIVKSAMFSAAERRLPQTCPSSLRDCPPNTVAPNPNGGDPIAGRASALEYQWCHAVRPGETTGSIAEKITGDRRRYLELVVANPQKGVATRNGEANFRDELCVGERLLVPKSWNPWIDQTGEPRGAVTAWMPFDALPPYPAKVELTPGVLPTADYGWG